MERLRTLVARLGQLTDSPRVVGVAVALCLGIALTSLQVARHPARRAVQLSAGDAQGRRAELARALATACAPRGLDLEIIASSGSAESLARVERRELGLALVQGGLDATPEVREVAPLTVEPLHLLVRGDADIYELDDLRGATVQLSPRQSGTRELTASLLALAHLRPGHDFVEASFSAEQLRELQPDALPDAIFHISTLPSPLARFLMNERGYRLIPLPFAEAMRLRDGAVLEGHIPAFTYGAGPGMPAADVPTLARRMSIVAHVDTPDAVVRTVLEALDSQEFRRASHLVAVSDPQLFEQPEFPLHPGARAWLHRGDPWLTSESVQGLESLRSFLVSIVVAGVLLARWLRRARRHGLGLYLVEVSNLENEALALERETRLDLSRLIALRARLGEVKARALRAFSNGSVHSDELLSSFLTHVSDVRSHINAMILHERDRREKTAHARGPDEEKVLRELWEGALDE